MKWNSLSGCHRLFVTKQQLHRIINIHIIDLYVLQGVDRNIEEKYVVAIRIIWQLHTNNDHIIGRRKNSKLFVVTSVQCLSYDRETEITLKHNY